jgi:signal transduction histidine kinase
VDEEIERLNKIVVDFLFAVRPMDVQLRESDPGKLVAEIADFIRPEAEKAKVNLVLRVAEGLSLVALDERLMKQALLNLVKNALAAMPGGGELKLSADSSDEEVILSVEDSGLGISEEDLPKIFEPYFTTKDNGTGLGLTITFKIVREHGGEITVSSRPGQGSTFAIHLPVPQKDKKLLPFDSGERKA